MTMKSLKLLIFICLAICYANSVKCDEDDSVYYGETSMSNIDDANKEYEDVSVYFPLNFSLYVHNFN